MKYGAIIGWGIVIYAVLYLAWSGLVIHGLAGGVLARVIVLGTLIVVSLIAGRSLKFTSWRDILPYSLCWVVVAAILDAIFTVPLTGWQLYLDWNLWVGYGLLLLVPLFAPYTRAYTVAHTHYT